MSTLREGIIMRTLFLLPASLLLLAASTGAQTLPYPRTETDPMSTVSVKAPPKTVRVRPDQAEMIGGSYAMSNGWRLKVRTASRHIDATIDREEPMRLYAVAPYKFASTDGNVNMEFNRGPAGEDMQMSYIPDQRLGQVVVISSQVAQR
jgi:nitrogen fixation protein